MFADAGEDDQRQRKADGRGYGVDHAHQQCGFEAFGVESAVAHQDGHAKDAAVGGDERQEDAESLIERGRHLFENNLNHLNQSGYHKNERYGLQIFDLERHEHVDLQQIGHDGGQRQHECDGGAHAQGRLNFFRHAQERAYSQELRQYDVVHEYCRDDYQYVFHLMPSLCG